MCVTLAATVAMAPVPSPRLTLAQRLQTSGDTVILAKMLYDSLFSIVVEVSLLLIAEQRHLML